jgi:hypothetical protein
MLKYKHFLLNHNKNEQITKNIMWFNKMRILYALTFLCMKLYILNEQWSENFVIFFHMYIYIYIM